MCRKSGTSSVIGRLFLPPSAQRGLGLCCSPARRAVSTPRPPTQRYLPHMAAPPWWRPHSQATAHPTTAYQHSSSGFPWSVLPTPSAGWLDTNMSTQPGCRRWQSHEDRRGCWQRRHGCMTCRCNRSWPSRLRRRHGSGSGSKDRFRESRLGRFGGDDLPAVQTDDRAVLSDIARQAIHRRGRRARFGPALLHLSGGYASKLDDPEVTGAAAIESDRITVPLMLVSGGDDGVWPSSEMARRLIERRRKAVWRRPRPTSCCLSRRRPSDQARLLADDGDPCRLDRPRRHARRTCRCAVGLDAPDHRLRHRVSGNPP